MKQLAPLSLLLAASALLWTTGCQQTSTKAPPPEPGMTPQSSPPPRQTTPAPTGMTRQDCLEPTTGVIRLSKQMPNAVFLGSTFEYQLMLVAQDCVDNIVVTDQIPAGASYVRSEPSAQQDGDRLYWRISPMDPGQSGLIRVWLTADQEGTLASCATVSADPRVCGSTFVGKPALAIEKSGPTTAVLGSPVNYTIRVSNNGSAIATGVKVTDEVPDGLQSSTGEKTLTFPVGDLAPGESKTMTVELRAIARGEQCNAAVASSDNAGEAAAEACTTILQPGLAVAKAGPEARFFGRNANYEIEVANVGDTPLTGVSVVDTAPPQTTVLSASNGGSVAGNQVTWNISTLAPGEKRLMEVVLTSNTAGEHCNQVAVTTAGGLRDSAEVCTLWSGVAAVLLECVDDPDPIQADEQTVYTVRVTNQGTADLTNIGISAVFDEEVTPVSSPQGTVDGQNVSFPVVPRLGPKQAITYTITISGVAPGDARNRISMTADGLKEPVIEEESTRVY